MNVFSLNYSPITVPYHTDKDQKVRKTVTLNPGRNKIDDEIWAKIKPRLEPKLDAGYLRASRDMSADLNRRELTDLVSQPSSGLVADLCAKAKAIDDGKIEGSDDQYYTVDELRKQGRL